MRMQVWISDELGAVLSVLAWKEKRWPKQQAEWLLEQALTQAAREGQRSPDAPVEEPALAPAARGADDVHQE